MDSLTWMFCIPSMLASCTDLSTSSLAPSSSSSSSTVPGWGGSETLTPFKGGTTTELPPWKKGWHHDDLGICVAPLCAVPPLWPHSMRCHY